MNKKALRDYIRSKYPDNPWVKKQIAKLRILRYNSTKAALNEADIKRAEVDKSYKGKIVKEQKKRINRKLYLYLDNSIHRLCDKLFKEIDQQEVESIIRDIWFCRLIYGFLPEEYICYELKDKDYNYRKSFISDIEKSNYVFRMNDISDIQILNDKVKTYQFFNKYYHRDAICVKTAGDFNQFLSFIQKHPAFVKKNAYESTGRSVELVDLSSNGRDAGEVFKQIIGDGKHILEEKVIQSHFTSDLHESSVNTIRCITFNTKEGITDKYYFMKVGQGGSFIDNGGAGGILVGIDRETGRLNTDGFDEYNRRYVTHPDTGITFKGFQLPEWNELRSLCKELSAKLPTVKFIGWDLAHTDDGWIVIEGNGMSQLIGPQTVFKRGCKAEVEALLEKMDLIL